MILRRLVLKNYRKYRAVDLELPAGLIAVVGKNGMGKTTLLEAAAFALYGPHAARDDLLGCLSELAGPDEHCELELELSVRGRPLRVVRHVRPRGTPQHQAELYEGGNPTPIAVGPAAVEAAVRRTLGMDYLTFTRSVFSKQKEVNALSAAKPEERRKAIRRMVGIEAISRACDEVRQDVKLKQRELDAARRAVETLPAKEQELEAHRRALGPARQAAATARKTATAALGNARRARALLTRLERQRSRDADLQRQKAGLEGDLRGAQRQAAELQRDLADIAGQRDDLAALLPEEAAFRRTAALKEKLDRASGRHEERLRLEAESAELAEEAAAAEAEAGALAGAPARARQARKDERDAQTAVRRAKAEVAAFQQARSQASQRLGGPQSQCERVRSALAQIEREGASGTCPTCDRPLGGTFGEILAHLRDELARHEAALEQARCHLETVETELRAWTAKHEEAERQVGQANRAVQRTGLEQQRLAETRKRLAEARRRIRVNATRLTALRRVAYDPKGHEAAARQYEQLAKVHDRVEALRQAVSRAPEVKRALGATRRRLAVAEAALGRIERRCAAVGFDRAAYDGARKDAERAQQADRDAAVARERAAAALTQVRERLDLTRAAVTELRRQQQLIARDEEALRYLERLEALLREFREDLAARVKPEIEHYASALLNQVTAGRYPRVELDDHYGISLCDGTATYPLKRFSGGEEDLANLCLRLAISQVVSTRHAGDGASLVVLDEVFGSQDSERREGILQALARLSETFQQVILITHMEDIHDRVPFVLRVTENAAREAEAAWL